MTKKFRLLKRTFSALFASTLIVGLMFAVSCDNDDDEPTPDLYSLPGIYTFKEAILQTDINIPGIPIPITAPMDITTQMAGGLLANANCIDPANGAVDLKSDFKLYFTCIGESTESQAGTWAINSDSTELSLNLAAPPLPAALSLKVEELTIDEVNDVIGGTINNFPLTKDLIAGFLAGYPEAQRDAILAGIPDNFVQLVDVDIKFQKEI